MFYQALCATECMVNWAGIPLATVACRIIPPPDGITSKAAKSGPDERNEYSLKNTFEPVFRAWILELM